MPLIYSEVIIKALHWFGEEIEKLSDTNELCKPAHKSEHHIANLWNEMDPGGITMSVSTTYNVVLVCCYVWAQRFGGQQANWRAVFRVPHSEVIE